MIHPEPKPFDGRLTFDGGQVCEGVQGELAEAVDPQRDPSERKTYSGRLWCEWKRATVEVLGRQANLQTANGLKARVAFRGVIDVEGDAEGGSTIEFDTVGSPTAGSFDAP